MNFRIFCCCYCCLFKFNIYKTNRKFDLNNSGNISSEELRVVLSKMHRFYSRDEVEDLIRKVDHNKDGLISIDEFAELLDLNQRIENIIFFKSLKMYLKKNMPAIKLTLIN